MCPGNDGLKFGGAPGEFAAWAFCVAMWRQGSGWARLGHMSGFVTTDDDDGEASMEHKTIDGMADFEEYKT